MSLPKELVLKEGLDPSTLRLEDTMGPETAYTVTKLSELTGKSYSRIAYKLKELESVGKSIPKIVDGKTYWILTDKAYKEGTRKERVKKER